VSGGKLDINMVGLGDIRDKLKLPNSDDFEQKASELSRENGISYPQAIIALREAIDDIIDDALLEPAGFMRCIECRSICERVRKDQRFCSRECANRWTVRNWRQRQQN